MVEAAAQPAAGSSTPARESAGDPVVIVGTGPVGIQAAREVLRLRPEQSLVLYGEEPWAPYNRVRLSDLLAGDVGLTEIANPIEASPGQRVDVRTNTRVMRIDRGSRIVTDAQGEQQRYAKLILATGSRAHRPNLPNVELSGVHCYRDMDDAHALIRNSIHSRHTVVLGGGALGLEVAFALKAQNAGTEVTIVHRSAQLMNRQLSEDAADVLRAQTESHGIHVRCGTTITEIRGDGAVEALRLNDDSEAPCDTLVLCTGIDPAADLARDVGLRVARGIKVDDYLQASDPHIYAVGECVEHRGRTYALLGAGIEQAKIAARNVVAGNQHRYEGSSRSLRLKVKNLSVVVVEHPRDLRRPQRFRTLTHHDAGSNSFRRLVLRRGRLAGATVLGEWAEMLEVQDAIKERRYIWPWQRARFLRRGALWPERKVLRAQDLPETALVCTCAGISRGTLDGALREGHTTVEALARSTGAGMSCGSCRYLLAQLVGAPVQQPVRPSMLPLAALTGLTVLLALLLAFLPAIPAPGTVRGAAARLSLLSDGLWQQVTGFSAVGVMLLGMGLSLRKRVSWLRWGSFARWREVHVGLAALGLLALGLHTGFELGAHFNLQVMLVFLAFTLSGFVFSAAVVAEHRAGNGGAQVFRTWALRLHMLLMWVFLGLIPVHVLAVYYF